MRTISISDLTLKTAETVSGLNFREKIELAKLLDRMEVSVIELPPLGGKRADSLLVKSVATAVKNAAVALSVTPEEGGAEAAWNAVKEASHPRLQLTVPASPMQMEYFWHKKPDKMLAAIRAFIADCLQFCPDVELVAQDAFRAEKGFLFDAVRTAVEAGAGRITLCEASGTLFPEEIRQTIEELYREVPALKDIHLSIQCADEMHLAAMCSLAAVQAGADEIKVVCSESSREAAAVDPIADIFGIRGAGMGLCCSLKQTELKTLREKIACLGAPARAVQSKDGTDVSADLLLSIRNGKEDIARVTRSIGYDLSEEDLTRVYEAFCTIAANKETVGIRELDSIVAAAAMQVPPTWRLHNYAINCVNAISASAHLQLEKNGELIEDISCGNGPIDAAFLCIEKIIGKHYELDDFQIQSVTEGREAMGETVVRLRSDGRLYSGRGISTDIICSGIFAYLSALNKIEFEEAEA